MSSTSNALPQFTVDQLLSLRRAQSVALSPCGRWAALCLERLLADGSAYAADIWRVPLDGKGAPVQLTRGKSRDTSPAFRADGALAFLSNRSDEELLEASQNGRTQIWLLPAQGGEPQRLSDEALGVESFQFAKHANRLVYLTSLWPGVELEKQRAHDDKLRKEGPSALHYTRMPVRDWDHWLPMRHTHLIVCDQHGQQRQDLTPEASNELMHAEYDLSRDGRQVVITWARPAADRLSDVALCVFDLEQGSQRLLAEQALTEADAPLFAPDGLSLVYRRTTRTPQQPHALSLQLLDLSTGVSRQLEAEWDAWPIPAVWHDDGKTLFVRAEEQGVDAIFALELQSSDVVRLTHAGSYSHLAYDAQRELLIGLRSAIQQPPEVFVLTCNDSAEMRIPFYLSGFAPDSLAFQQQELHLPSSDGHLVQARLLLPAASDGPVPLLVWVHGGPVNAWLDNWHWRWCPLLAVAQGYAVLLPNPRGSTGFGRAFIEGIWGNEWGAQCYRDIMAVVDHVATLPEIDAQRIAVMGASFGGYMTNWIGTQNTNFRCLVSHAGVYSMSGFTGHTDQPVYWYQEMNGKPYADPVAFDRYSPSRYISNWQTPVLITHGALDYRVPVNESLALFEALQCHGVPSELLVFPDENHWILKPNNSRAWYGAVFSFLQKHLAAGGDAVANKSSGV